MNKKLLVSALLVGALLLSVPALSSAFGIKGFWGSNPGYGSMGQGMPMMGFGMVGPGMGSGMMGMTIGGGVTLKEPVNQDKAKELVQNYLANTGLKGLSLAEIMEFDSHFYVELKEDQTGKYAEELIVDKKTGTVSPEIGPNMMWNTKYGHMGMMMGFPADTPDKPVVSPDEAVKRANDYLTQANSGETAAEPHEFYGYYTLHTMKDGKVVGMLSVNSSTGQVWYHSWHGNFVGMEEADGDAQGHDMGQNHNQ
ncbi:hypothetical protein [Desulfotomaculum nigrificans]|uniref:hypothetical protein n=1 Tax=Desulfotomaculum nigrificans TaxID=1565 RepID=UPI0001FAE9D1|nr:hypothetical protein [Desulfotomaculum nigrificans]